jgi:hypothetical protein
MATWRAENKNWMVAYELVSSVLEMPSFLRGGISIFTEPGLHVLQSAVQFVMRQSWHGAC